MAASSFRSDDAILSGSLTKLNDGTSYLVAGAGIEITTGSNGAVTITNDGSVGDITSVTAGTGLIGGGTTGGVTLDIDDSIVATLTGSQFTGNVGITGSLQVKSGDISLEANSNLRFNNPGQNDQFIYGNNTAIVLDADDGIVMKADSYIYHMIASDANYANIFTPTQNVFNFSVEDIDFRVNTNDYYGTIFVDANDNTVILGNEGFDSSPTASEVSGYGTDVKLYLSGTAGTKDSATRGVTLVSGDMVISGSSYMYDDLNLSVNKAIYFNNPGGTADQYIKSVADVFLDIEADDYLRIYADESIDMNVNDGSTSSRFEMAPKNIWLNRTTSTTSDTSLNNSLLFVSGGVGSVSLGGTSYLNYGTDVKLYLSGTAGTKDTSTRGVTLVSGDMVVSGNMYDKYGNDFTKDVEKGSVLVSLGSNAKQYFPADDQQTESSIIQYYSFVAPVFSGSFNKIGLRASNTSSGGQLSDLGGITASFHRGYPGTDPITIGSSPDFKEDVFIDLSSHPADTTLIIDFSGSNFNPGDTYAWAIQPNNNWNTGGNMYLGYTVITSRKINE